MFEFMGVCVSTAHMTEKDESILQALTTNGSKKSRFIESFQKKCTHNVPRKRLSMLSF